MIHENINESFKEKAIFSIPDFYNNFNLNLFLVNLQHTNPELFNPNCIIGSVYGTFPGCIWNGGRGQGGSSSYNNIIATLVPFLRLGVQIRFTFTNQSEAMKENAVLNDWYANKICEYAQKSVDIAKEENEKDKDNSYPVFAMNNPIAVNINSDNLAEYIAKKYPDFQVINSTTKCSNDIDKVNKMSEHNLTVLNYTMNNTNAIPMLTHKDNIEVLVCEACIDNCPNRYKHYQDISNNQIYLESYGFKCPNGCEQFLYYETVTTRHHHITHQMIKKDYIPIGINQFKISGRNNNIINTIESYAIYFAADGQRDNLRNRLLLSQFMK